VIKKLQQFQHETRYPLIELPQSVKKFAKKIILLGFMGNAISGILTFCLKGSQLSLKNGNIVLAIILLVFHFGNRIIHTLYNTWYDLQDNAYNRLITSEKTKAILNVSNVTRNKVFQSRGKLIEMIDNAEVLKVTKDYLSDYWSFYVRFPSTLLQVGILLVMLISSTIIQLKTSTFLETIIITSMLIIAFIVYFYLSNRRIKIMREYRKVRKENEAKSDVLFTEIKACDFVSDKDFVYHAEKLRTKLDENIQVERVEGLRLNKVFIQRSITASISMILITVIKIIVTHDFSAENFFDIIALCSIYSTMLNRIQGITESYERIMDIVIDIDTLNPDFDIINTVYTEENNKTTINYPIERMDVAPFSVTQDINGAFELINNTAFSLVPNDVVMTYGRTGCGKSTLINMFTGKMSLKQNPINFSNGKNGYLNSIGYQTDRAMANNYVLYELTLTDNDDEIDHKKFIEIIKGLQLYDELLRMIKEEKLDFSNLGLNNDITDEEKIIEFLKIRKTREFSSGQMQRLALAKLMYSLDDTIQLVALDEPFNRLDDTTCDKCMQFIKEYVQKTNRILFIATHQVEILKPYCNIFISFNENLKKSIIRVDK
jgi:ABC-type multidrug transport system fused ATPase/permease subunit